MKPVVNGSPVIVLDPVKILKCVCVCVRVCVCACVCDATQRSALEILLGACADGNSTRNHYVIATLFFRFTMSRVLSSKLDLNWPSDRVVCSDSPFVHVL